MLSETALTQEQQHYDAEAAHQKREALKVMHKGGRTDKRVANAERRASAQLERDINIAEDVHHMEEKFDEAQQRVFAAAQEERPGYREIHHRDRSGSQGRH